MQREGRVVAIGDTKWKRLKISRGGVLVPSPEDVYQMQAYAAAYHCLKLTLMNPCTKPAELENLLEMVVACGRELESRGG